MILFFLAEIFAFLVAMNLTKGDFIFTFEFSAPCWFSHGFWVGFLVYFCSLSCCVTVRLGRFLGGELG